MATGYVANWGNDNNDGLSWETAKRSLQGAKDAGLNPIYVKGYYTEFLTGTLYGGIFNGYNISTYSGGGSYYNCIIENNTYMDVSGLFGTIAKKINMYRGLTGENSIIINFLNSRGNTGTPLSIGWGGTGVINFTFFNTDPSKILEVKGFIYNSIVTSSDINVRYNQVLKYSLFINNRFKFNNGGLGNDETDYTYPAGATDIEKLQNLRSRMAVVYGGQANDYLVGCRYYSGSYNNVFVDADNGNFYLKNTQNNPALHIGYNGEYAGARPTAATTFKIANANTVTNINQATGDIIDQSLQASAYWTTIQDAGAVREISNFDTIAEMAYRNGLSINTASYMSADITAGSNVLISGKQYQVRDDAGTGGTIVLNDSGGTIFSAWNTFTAVDEGGGAGLGFLSIDGLTVREIDISKYDERIRIKVSTDDATLSSANEITMLLHETPLVNVDSNNIPIKGNGDVGFDAASAVPLQARYMQIWVDIQADQLYAR